jgi:hypothetical protein
MNSPCRNYLKLNKKPGYNFGAQLSVGPLGRRLCALRERPRIVSGIIPPYLPSHHSAN